MTRAFCRWLLATVLAFFALAGYAQQVSDESAPHVSGGSLSVSSIDTAVNSSLTVTAQATDDLSGVNYVYVYLRTTATGQPGNSTSIGCYLGTLQSGSRTNGTFTGQCAFSLYSQSGTWFVYQVYTYDMVGNYRTYHNNGNALSLIPGTIQVTAPTMPQSAAPRISSITLSPASVDVSAGGATVTFEISVQSSSGIEYAWINVNDPTNSYGSSGYVYPSQRISGTSLDGVYRGSFTIPRFARGGAWRVVSAGAYSAGWNSSISYGWTSNGQYGGAWTNGGSINVPAPAIAPSSINVVSNPSDTTAPMLVEFALSPRSIDVAAGPAEVRVTVHATDDLSGFNYACYGFVSPNGQQYRSSCSSASNPTGTLYFPQFSQAGNWNLNYMYLYDGLNNYRYYYANDLAALGFPTSIQISSGLSVSDASGSVGGQVTLNARLTYLGQPAAGKTIEFKINNSSVGSAITGANGVASLSGVSLGSIAAGFYLNAITATFAGEGSQAAASGSANLTVTNKLDQSISFDELADRTLSQSPFTVSATASSGLAVSFAAIGSCSVSGSSVTLNSAGECRIVASQAGNATYNAAPSVSRSFNVTAKSDQTITFPAIADRMYGGAAFDLGATASSQLPVTFSASGPCSLNGSTLSITGAGSCSVTASQAGNASWNAAPDVTRSFGIGKANLAVRADDKTQVYGATPPGFTYTATGFVNGDGPSVLRGTASYSNGSGNGNVGTYDIGISGLSADNYHITFAPGKLTITAATLVVRGDSLSKRYGDPMPALTATAEGLVNGDTLAGLGTLSFTTTATAASGVGTYRFTPGGLATTNYTVSYHDGMLEVIRAKAMVIANDATKAYGASLPALTHRVEGLVNGDTSSSLAGTATVTTTATASSPAGTYPINVAGLSSPNYDITFKPGTLSVTRVGLTITAEDRAKAYGAAMPAFGAVASGFVNGDTMASLAGSLGFSSAATAASPAGSYAITPGGVSSPNYDIAFVPGTLLVTPVPLTIQADDASKVYGANLPAFTVSAAGLVNGDTLASLSGVVTFATSASPASPVGSYAVMPGGLSSGNYLIAFVPGTLKVLHATLVVAANSAQSQYSDPLSTLTAAISGLVNGDSPAVVSGQPALATTATPQSAPGQYSITVGQGTLAAQNYVFTGFTPNVYTVKAENARAAYTGLMFASTSAATSGLATVSLSTAIQDISAWPADPAHDSAAGDIRKATVTFVNRDAGDAVLCTAVVGLVSAADTRSGMAACTWNADIGTRDSMSITLGVMVGGHYAADVDEAIVTVSRPLTTQFVTGGGYLTLAKSAGEAAGAAGSKANFGFNVKFDKAGTRLEGNMNLIIRAGGKTFQVDATSFESLSVQAGSPARGAFAAKASIRDITDEKRPILIDAEATLQVGMADHGQPGSGDMLAITVLNRSGGLWFSSNWSGAGTVEQTLGGGNIVVH